MSGTHLFYNGVLLRDCDIKQWHQEIVRDDSGTDVLYSKVTLTVESTLVSLLDPTDRYAAAPTGGYAAPLSTVAVPKVTSANNRNENVVDRWRELQWRLQEVRKDFWLAINGVTLQPLSPPAAGLPPVPEDNATTNSSYRVILAATGLSMGDIKLDANELDLGKIAGWEDNGLGTPTLDISRAKVIDLNNGPKPLSVDVQRVFGGRALRVALVIEVCRCFCKPDDSSTDTTPPIDGAGKIEGVISNRWSLTETLDAEWKTTHHIDGQLRVADARYKPHAMRLMIQPLAFPHARYISRSFSTDPTNLVLAYRFDIKETGQAAPRGIVDWKGRYSEGLSRGGRKSAHVNVRVTGYTDPRAFLGNSADPYQTQKQFLIGMAFRIAQARIRWDKQLEPLPGQVPTNITLTDCHVSEPMDDAVIELSLGVIYTDAPNNDGLVSDRFGLRLANMGRAITDEVTSVQPSYNPKWWPNPAAFPWDVSSWRSDQNITSRGSYFDCYFQTCCSDWHAMQLGFANPSTVLRDEGGGGGGGGGSGGDFNNSTSWDNTTTTLIYDPGLVADETPPGFVLPASANWWNVNQARFAYIQADIDTRYDVDSGRVQVGLSKARANPVNSVLETSAVVRLHAGVVQRVITMVATREGKRPQLPAPQTTVQHGLTTETFLHGKIINEASKLLPDGRTYWYCSQIQWVYALNRVPDRIGTGSLDDKLLCASSPMDKRTPVQEQISVLDYFSFGEIEISTGAQTLF